MEASLRTLLDGVIDYAGMFPPAEQTLPAAVTSYLAHRRHPLAWMLGSLIVPAVRLGELEAYRAAFASLTPRAGLIGLGTPAADRDALQRAIATDHGALRHHARSLPEIGFAAYETRLPVGVADDPEAVDRGLSPFRDGAPALPIYLEPLPDPADPAGSLRRAIVTIAALRRDRYPTLGFKLRCGGTTPAAFPTTATIAAVLLGCAEHQLPLKCTAGLHHPIRAWNAALGVTMHGFVNLLAAAVFVDGGRIDPPLLVQLLDEQDPDRFHAEGVGLGWRGLRATVPEIATARRRLLVGFGSCSFDEPVDDLCRLHWL